MVKLLVFAILLASSPATALLETLYNSESNCYSVCAEYYKDNLLEFCKKGCDFKLHNEGCEDQCKSVSDDKEIQESCQKGCELNDPLVDDILNSPDIAVDPIPTDKTSEVPVTVAATTAAVNEPEIIRPHSIILIRLRQRPSIQFPSMQNFFGNDPVQMFNSMIQQFQDHAKTFEEAIRSQLANNAGENQQLSNLPILSELPKVMPMHHMQMQPFDTPAGEQSDHHRMMHAFHHHFGHPHGGPFRDANVENVQPENSRVRQFFTDVHTEWNDLVRKQPKIPIWIFLGIFLSSSVILWYMIMSLCRHAPNRDPLSIRAQEVVFHPYDYEGYEKAKIQPDDDTYDVAESVPIKVKLTNI